MPRRLTLSIDPQLLPRFPSMRLGGFLAVRIDRVASALGNTQLRRLCRTIALRHFVPLGAYDVDALPDPAITIRMARPLADWFVPLGARPNDVPLGQDVVVLAAGATILTSGYNESRQTCLSPDTRRAAFVSEAICRADTAAAQAALEDLRRLLTSAGALLGDAVYVDAGTLSAELRCADTSWAQ